MCRGISDMGCGQSKVAASPEHSYTEKENNVTSKIQDSPEREGYQLLTYQEEHLPVSMAIPETPPENNVIAVRSKEMNGSMNKLLEKAHPTTWRPFRERSGSVPSEAQSDENLEKPPGFLIKSYISESQAEFFRILDEKIANGPDYEGEGC